MKQAQFARVFFPTSLIQAWLIMDLHERTVPTICCLTDLVLWERPTEQPFGFFGTHVDTAMTHGDAEVFMPIGSVKSMSLGCEKRRPGNAREFIIICIGKEIAIAHVLGWILFKDTKITLRRFSRKTICAAWTIGYSRGNGVLKDLLILLKGSQGLHGQIDFDAFLFKGDIRRNRGHFLSRNRTHVQRINVIGACQIIDDPIPWLSGRSRFDGLYPMSGLIIQTKTKLLPAVGLARSPGLCKRNGHLDDAPCTICKEGQCLVIKNLYTLQVGAVKKATPYAVPNRVMSGFIYFHFTIDMQ